MKTKIHILILTSLLALSGCSSSNEISFQSYPNSELSSFVSLDKVHTALDAAKICKKAKKSLVTARQFAFLQGKIQSLKVIASADSRRAHAFISQKNSPKMLNTSIYKEKGEAYQTLIREETHLFLQDVFDNFSDENGKTLSQEDRLLFTQKWGTSIQRTAVTYCNLDTSQSDEYLASAEEFNGLFKEITFSASLVPWYPAGFEEWAEDPSLAWKWSDGGYCQLGDSCWHLQVLALDGCSSLYGEINIEDSSGNVIDYTNDRVGRLGAGSSVILEFSTYNDYASTGRLTELNCHG